MADKKITPPSNRNWIPGSTWRQPFRYLMAFFFTKIFLQVFFLFMSFSTSWFSIYYLFQTLLLKIRALLKVCTCIWPTLYLQTYTRTPPFKVKDMLMTFRQSFINLFSSHHELRKSLLCVCIPFVNSSLNLHAVSKQSLSCLSTLLASSSRQSFSTLHISTSSLSELTHGRYFIILRACFQSKQFLQISCISREIV